MPRAYTFPTTQEVISQAMSEAQGSTTSAITANQTTALLRKLDKINRDFINRAHTRHHAGGFSWMEEQTNFRSVQNTTLSTLAATTDVTLELTSASNFDTAGSLYIKTAKGTIDFVNYTGKSSNTLSGVTGISLSHATAEKVGKNYALPSNFNKARVLIANAAQEYIYNRDQILPLYSTYYTHGAYLVLPEGVGAQDFSLWYEKSPTDLFGDSSTNSTDLSRSMDIPEDFMDYPVLMLSSYILKNRRKRQDSFDAKAEAESKYSEYLTMDSLQTTGVGLSSGW